MGEGVGEGDAQGEALGDGSAEDEAVTLAVAHALLDSVLEEEGEADWVLEPLAQALALPPKPQGVAEAQPVPETDAEILGEEETLVLSEGVRL